MKNPYIAIVKRLCRAIGISVFLLFILISSSRGQAFVAAQDGPWSDPDTWQGIGGPGAEINLRSVEIPIGITVSPSPGETI